MKILYWCVAFLLVAIIANAQPANAVSTSKLGWDIDGPSVEAVTAYVYTWYADGVENKGVLVNVVCTGTATPYQCVAPFPAFTPGQHRIMLTAKNEAGESGYSNPLDFVFVVTPAIPGNLRIGQ